MEKTMKDEIGPDRQQQKVHDAISTALDMVDDDTFNSVPTAVLVGSTAILRAGDVEAVTATTPNFDLSKFKIVGPARQQQEVRDIILKVLDTIDADTLDSVPVLAAVGSMVILRAGDVGATATTFKRIVTELWMRAKARDVGGLL
jgi:hypothetical protein